MVTIIISPRKRRYPNIKSLSFLGVFERDLFNKPNRSEEELPKDDDVIGGLFRIAQYQKHKDKVEKDNMDIFESPLIDRCDTKAQKSWLDPDVCTLIIR